MSILTLDCETLPLASSLRAPYPEADRPAPANYKNPEAIAGWRVKDREVWAEQRVKECSLTPRLGRIACFGFALDGGVPETIVVGDELSESTMLFRAWQLIGQASVIVTFNGSFDLRFIAIRSAILGLTPPPFSSVRDWFRRYTVAPHFDCRAVLTGWDDRQSGKLTDWCASFGIPCEDTTIGGDVFALAQAGEWDAIAAHCRSDVECTRALYRRVAPLFT